MFCTASILTPCHFVIFDDNNDSYKIKYTPPASKTITRASLAQEQVQQQAKKQAQEWDIYAGVAIFMDMGDQSSLEKKPKWELILGQGPQRIELDSSRSGRIYKQSLKQLNLKMLNRNYLKIQSSSFKYSDSKNE